MRNNMITKKLIKFALLFFLIGLTACDNKLNPGFDPDDYEPIVPPEPVRTMDAMASGERVVLSGASLTDIVLGRILQSLSGTDVEESVGRK